MKERGILFSVPMVRALLAGTKTHTRRLIKPQPELAIMDSHAAEALRACQEAGIVPSDERPMWRWKGCFNMPWPHCMRKRSPYGVPGDRLWVRETFDAPPGSENRDEVAYRADYERDPDGALWRPSLFMPRWASRITLEIIEVRAERLQSISEADAKAEGVELVPPSFHEGETPYRAAFSALWDAINYERAPWASNPWVWVVSFRRLA